MTIKTPSDVKAGDDTSVSVSIPDATGDVTVIVDGVETVVPLDDDGNAVVPIENVAAGEHSVVVIYPGDDKFNSVHKSASFNVEDEPVPVKEDANVTIDVPTGYKAGEPLNVTVYIPGATGNVTAIVDGIETVVPLDEKGNATITINNLTIGDHDVVVIYPGDDSHKSAHKVVTIPVEALSTEFTNVVVASDLYITGVLVNALGDAVGDAEIKYSVGGINGTTTTNAKGEFTIQGVSGEKITIEYAGNDFLLPTIISLTLEDVKPVRAATMFNITNGTCIDTYTVDFKIGEHGNVIAFRLTDNQGNPITNASVGFAYKTVYFNRTTDENGIVSIGISTQFSGEYLCALSYLGDDKYNATFVAFYFNIQKKPIKISASDKTFKKATKTKKYTIALKTGPYNSKDGKTYLKAGKKVTLKINGKTYKAKINAKGKATFKITKLTKKGKFTAVIKFAGDKTYKAASKKVKITVK